MADSIHVKLPDGSVKEVPKGTTALDIAKSISPRLADAALAAKVRPLSGNGATASEGSFDCLPPVGSSGQIRPTQASSADANLIDLTRPLEEDTELGILT